MAERTQVASSSGSDIVYDFFCELCFADKLQVEAEGFCVDCEEYLCGSCYRGHKKSRWTRHHTLQDKTSMPSDTPLSIDRVIKDVTTTCKLHSSKLVEYYCRSHKVLGCSTCFVEGHRSCSDIESIVDVSVNIFENQEFKNFLGQLQSMQRKSRDILACARENKSVSQGCFADVVSSAGRLKEEAILKLNEAEQNIVALAKQIQTEDEEKMESVEKECERLSGQFEQISSDVEILQISKRICQLYIIMRDLQHKMKSLQENLEKLDVDNFVRTFRFEPNRDLDLSSFLKSPTEFGKISYHLQHFSRMRGSKYVETPRASAESRAHDTTEMSQKESTEMLPRPGHQHARANRSVEPVSAVDPNNVTASYVADIVAGSGSEFWSNCRGSTVVSKNRLLLADGRNHKVKLVDTHTQRILSELQLSSAPWDVAFVKRNQAAVTLPDSQMILLLGVADMLTSQRGIPIRGKCRSIAYSQDRLVVTFENSSLFQIIDLHGNIIRSFENTREESKLPMSPWYVCVSNDNIRI